MRLRICCLLFTSKTEDKNLPIMAVEEVKKARAFHESFPQYKVTPLADLKSMAEYLGLAKAAVKDESYRFGLNAFKVLGGSYAIAKYIAKETGRDISEMPYNVLTSKELKDEFGPATFFSATDGNHGRGVEMCIRDRLESDQGEAEVICLPGQLLLPGFVNGHNHMYGVLSHGITAETMVTDFSNFLEDFWWPYVEDRVDHDLARITARWACVETVSYTHLEKGGLLLEFFLNFRIF